MLYEWARHIEFANNWMLPFLLLLPVVAWIFFRMEGRLRSSFTVTTRQAFRVRTFRNNLVHLPLWLRLAAIGCVILALARPQVAQTEERRKGEGIDIMLCMDISGSMVEGRDFYPNRLVVAKAMAEEFVRARPVDRIGLVVFSGESYTQAPLSTDHESLIQQIRGLRAGTLQDGTLIGEGLATSVDRLSRSDAASRVVILLTDGKEVAPATRIIDPLTALQIARAKGVKVYTIGMAAASDPTSPGIGGPNSDFLDETLLRRIATQTGGEYFRATDREGLQEVYRQIDRLEKSEFEVITRTRQEEYFHYFIGAALLFLALELLLRYTLFRVFP